MLEKWHIADELWSLGKADLISTCWQSIFIYKLDRYISLGTWPITIQTTHTLTHSIYNSGTWTTMSTFPLFEVRVFRRLNRLLRDTVSFFAQFLRLMCVFPWENLTSLVWLDIICQDWKQTVPLKSDYLFIWTSLKVQYQPTQMFDVWQREQ